MFTLGHFNLIQYFADDFIRSHITCFSFISQTDAVAQYIMCHGAHIFRDNIATAFDESITACRQCQIDRCTRGTAESDHIFQFFQIILLRITGCKYNIDNIFFNLFIQIYLTYDLTRFDNLVCFQNRLYIQSFSVYILAYN